MNLTGSDRQRFVSRISKLPSGCWERKAFIDVQGYGRFYIGKKPLRAHRVAYEIFVGSIPDGLVLDHLCRNRACVNPSHLEAVTPRINTVRGLKSYVIRDTCKHGHDVTDPSNVYIGPDGRRDCRACVRDRVRRHQERVGRKA